MTQSVEITILEPDGSVWGTVSCPEHEIEAQLPSPQHRYLYGYVDGATEYVDFSDPKHPMVRKIPERPVVYEAYFDARRAEYPPIEDQLDAIWQGGEAFEQMRARVLDVKRRHPKPDSGQSAP